MTLLRNLNQKRILFAEDGIDRWNAANVACAILRRIERQGHVTINHFDVQAINRMHKVLHTGGHYNNPFQSLAADTSTVTVAASELGF